MPLANRATATSVTVGGGVAIPDPHLTPGAVFDVTAEQVCTPGYSKSVRNVSTTTKD